MSDQEIDPEENVVPGGTLRVLRYDPKADYTLDYEITAAAQSDTYKRTWDRLRHYTPSDLNAMIQVVDARLEEVIARWEYEYREGDTGAYLAALEDKQELEAERATLLQLIAYHFRIGPDGAVPKWGEVEDKLRPGVITHDLKSLPKKTRRYLYVASQLDEEPVDVQHLVREVADIEGISESTAYKWLCDRNPLYEAGKKRLERISMLRKLILQVTASREVA
jgi:hypothetical protein